jgi:hypothetical protein
MAVQGFVTMPQTSHNLDQQKIRAIRGVEHSSNRITLSLRICQRLFHGILSLDLLRPPRLPLKDYLMSGNANLPGL